MFKTLKERKPKTDKEYFFLKNNRLHPTGFEPAKLVREWIMSPVPSTTRPRMRK